MLLVERALNAHNARKEATHQEGGWGKWASEHKSDNDLLIWLTKVGNDGE